MDDYDEYDENNIDMGNFYDFCYSPIIYDIIFRSKELMDFNILIKKKKDL